VRKTIEDIVRLIVKNKSIEVKSIDLYMWMLLHLNEDFDDDLLQEATSLLVDL